MPLRDHFHSPLDDRRSWDELHGAWPTVIVMALNSCLPPRYVAAPSVHVGIGPEIDVGSFEEMGPPGSEGQAGQGGLATQTWAPPRPTLDVATGEPDPDEYEVRVYDTRRERRLVATIELLSPANKDRPETRRLFAAKCAALLRQQVCVALVDVVTSRRFNLYGELLDLLGQVDPSLPSEPTTIYAAACRWRGAGFSRRLQTWAHPLALGQPLPTLPLWLADDLAVPLDLEGTYEQTCRILRMA